MITMTMEILFEFFHNLTMIRCLLWSSLVQGHLNTFGNQDDSGNKLG
jgi:hypothetical protein